MVLYTYIYIYIYICVYTRVCVYIYVYIFFDKCMLKEFFHIKHSKYEDTENNC